MNANFESHSISRRSFLKASGVVGAASILAACGGSSSSTAASTSGAASGAAAPAADAITDYVSFETAKRELETWNFLYSQSASDMNVTTNCWDGLLSFDCYGKAVPAIASSWEHNEDSTVWTFHLRDDVDWCDVNGEVKSHLTSKDFLVGFEWVLNAIKNEAFNTSMPSETVVGAAEYYDLTKDKGDAAADMTYEDMLAAGVGVEAPDDYTLVFTCKNPCPYFDTVAAYNSFYPASEDLIKELGIDLSLGENYLDGFKGQDIIMRTPGFVGYFEKPLQDAMAAGTMVTSEVELFFQFCPCEIVAVTGSDGKTTTTTLISKFYEAAGRRVHLGGNIGAALLPMLPEVSPDDVAVVELSSFQLISMHQSPNIAVVTNVTPNHLDHHKDMQEYIDAKRNILLYQKQPCRAVLGYENEISRSMQKDCKGKQVWFTRLHETDNGAFLREDGMLCMAENGVVTPFLAQKDVKLRGLHNIENLLAAAAAVWGEVPVEAIQLVGSSFTGVEHRIEPVRVLDGVTYYNDSIGTSPTRTIAGLRSFDQKVILIAGGYDKHIPYEPLAPEITAHVKNLVLMGATGPRIEKAVREDPNFNEAELPIQHADNMQHAVELARACAKPGDIIILSPASASFDLYPNFEVRGREFKSIVNALK